MDQKVRFLTSKQVMEIIQISRPTLHRWIKKSVIPFVKVGGEYRFPAEYFEDLCSEAMNK